MKKQFILNIVIYYIQYLINWGENVRELKSVEEKILDRSLYLFGKNGSTNVPIRTIAKEANVITLEAKMK